jgi:hypothetical protein
MREAESKVLGIDGRADGRHYYWQLPTKHRGTEVARHATGTYIASSSIGV